PAVVLLGVLQEREPHLVHRHVSRGRSGERTGSELSEEPLVLGFGLRGPPRAERERAAGAVVVHVEDGSTFVVPGDRDDVAGTRHSDNPRIAGTPAKPRLLNPRSPTSGGKLNCFG